MVGYHRFNEIRHALPLISPSVLSQRLRSLEEDGVIVRRGDAGGASYHLTEAGKELRPVVEALGQWARRWVTRDYREYELDPGVLMWSLRRHVVTSEFPFGGAWCTSASTGRRAIGATGGWWWSAAEVRRWTSAWPIPATR
jgi:hypothetical protein